MGMVMHMHMTRLLRVQVDEAKLEVATGCSCMLVEEGKLELVTGRRVGCVHPFVRGITRRFVDLRVGKEGGIVSFNTGDMSRGIVMSKDGLLAALGDQARIVDIACAEGGEEVEDLAAELSIARHDARFLFETEGGVAFYQVGPFF